eukprot:CAMPEP_0181343456 /NCGR_PEP_ID=MMETSP1101-20121128/31597_1 /TAXON_ID=46948 /ORGANISM="Rhodomonas abbreviata, Strain Caron Lab Isolate" /LENGTH=254 /DNA_ID=CAMNT_0023455089 /DNA_START=334 /DNA_END=1095 /DNA_ORIENTATION=-
MQYRLVFCNQDLQSCLAQDSTIKERKGRYDLLWLKTEGEKVPDRVLTGTRAVNAFGIGWQIWSRRSLCLAMQANRASFKQGKHEYLSWYPDCLALPSQQDSAAVESVSRSLAPWVIHGAQSKKNHIFQSGKKALGANVAGVLHNYISPCLTFRGFKFTLVLYAAVTSISPLRAYLFRDAHILLARRPYALNSETMSDAAVHSPSEAEGEAKLGRDGGLWGRRGLMQTMNQSGIPADFLWNQLQDAVAVALLSAA